MLTLPDDDSLNT